MPIVDGDIKYYRPVSVNDTSANGGRLSASQITHNVKNNVWPDVPQAERLAGSTRYRKIFIKVANDDDLALADARLFIDRNSPGDDWVLMFPGTQTNTQNDITGNERLYGAGALGANLAVGATTVTVLCESTAAIFQNGDIIRISDKADVNDLNGTEDFCTISAVAWNSTQATLTLASGVTNTYSATHTRVASCITVATVQGTVDNWAETSPSGTFDETAYSLGLDNIGTIEETWTFTFTSATAFTCSGDTVGEISSGTTTANFSPNNPAFNKPYFTLASAGWGGTWAQGDTLVFRTHPAAIPVWQKRVVPPGANSIASNAVTIAIVGATA